MSKHEGVTDLQDPSTHDEVDAEEEKARNEALAQRETKAISYIRLVVFFVLVAVAAAICATIYVFATNTEKERFESAFADQSSKVIEAFRTNAQRRIAAIDSLSMAFTSHALSTNSTWPQVTLPDYERRASRVMDLAEVIAIFQFPLITNETRQEYEAYALENQGWLQEGLEYRQEEILQRIEDGDSTFEDEAGILEFLNSYIGSESSSENASTTLSIPAQIYQPIGAEVGPEDGPGPYFPVWQFAPALPLPDLVNFNAIKGPSHTRELEAILENQRVVTSKAFDFSDETDPNVYGRKALLNLLLNRWKGGGNEYEDGPVSDLYYPIYDSFNTTTRKLVAVFDTLVYWQVYFVNILPQNSDGVDVVLENTCNQTFSYTIDGPVARYLGPGDMHSRAYDKYEVSTGFGAFLGVRFGEVIGDTSHCSYNVKVYPSLEMEEQYKTNTPLVFAVVLVFAFLFTSLTFVVYDYLVSIRQRKLLDTAVKSTAVVETLFPHQVRSGLYAQTNKDKNAALDKLDDDDDVVFINLDKEDTHPNAHLYPEATVFFADLAGFTKWSSTKQPAEVFKLLETLYDAFDRIAERKKVFKVETIGDCYMCVTGVPKAQNDHAIRMARFAHECLVKMNQLQDRLVSLLGPETRDLALRVGLHSGPVTGGVLRGAKARFQLFGDTVNTASRMESTGMPWKIHASAATADVLIQAGRGSWVQEREDKVEAKGKGIMSTYWIIVKGEGSVVSNTLTTSSTTSAEVIVNAIVKTDSGETPNQDVDV